MKKYNFVNFIKNPGNYSSEKFISKNKKIINQLNKIKLKKCNFKKDNLVFKKKTYQKLYDNSPGLPSIETIINNPKKNYIIIGGIKTVGARYPDYIINKNDILYLKKVMEKYGIFKIPISNIKKVSEKCILLVQEKLKTNLFNNIKYSRWIVFDMMTNSFRNLCLGIETYSQYKNKLVPTNLSMLLFLIGDCREHRLLLLYFMRIYLYYKDTNKKYLAEPIYTNGGHGEKIKNKMVFINHNYEHTYVVLIDRNTQEIFALDALEHKTKNLPNPELENMNWKTIDVVNHKYYTSGYYRINKKPYLVELVDWWSNTPCEYTTNKMLSKKVFVYGIPFSLPNIKYVFNKQFNKLISKRLYNSNLCKPKRR